MTPFSRTSIDTGWEFRQADAETPAAFRPVASFPTNIHLDLLAHKLIPDPTHDLNAREVQWVGEKEWIYQTTFSLDSAATGSKQVLVFKGLDTFCSIKVNGNFLERTENMFLEYRVDVTGKLKVGVNKLELYFESAWFVGKRLEKEQGFKNLFWNGDSSRLNVRKVGCHYGWDWGPTLMTAGPFRPIFLEVYDLRISDLEVDIEVANDLNSAILQAKVELEGNSSSNGKVIFTLIGPTGDIVQKAEASSLTHTFYIDNPQLWYPIGYGSQPLYTVTASLSSGLDTASRRIGIRLSELVQTPLPGKDGTTFFFRVNNIPIFCRGTNWIPGDTYLSRLTPSRYRAWLELATQSNQNMIRVWGGGTFEDDVFYDLADELGLLIWHDFMLGCGAYPVNDALLKTIKEEAEYNVRRTRHHPCIVLWCGNNEDHMFAELHHLEYDMADKDPQHWLKTNWPARYYYEKLFPDICASLAPRIPYHISSPYGGSYSNDSTVGDVHAWRVWMADQPRYPYQDYENLTGRFVSEFGMKSFPPFRTLKQLISNPGERYPQSKTLDAWHMAPEDQRTIALYLIDNFRHNSNNLEAYVYITQVLQAEAMSYAVRAFRRPWRGPGHEECAGSLIWQLNDCFPSVSWSLADSALRRKLVYYVVNRSYAPLLVGISRRVRETRSNEFTNVDVRRTYYVEVWGSNLTLKPVEAELQINFLAVDGGRVIESIEKPVKLPPNRSTELEQIDFPESHDPDTTIVSTKLVVDQQITRFVDWPQPLKYLDLSKVEVIIQQSGHDLLKVGVKGGPAKAVELFLDTDDISLEDQCVFEDNCLDLVPGDDQTIRVEFTGDRKPPLSELKFKTRHLGHF